MIVTVLTRAGCRHDEVPLVCRSKFDGTSTSMLEKGSRKGAPVYIFSLVERVG